MTKKSNIGKSQRESLAKVIKQMDSWMQNETNLNLLIERSSSDAVRAPGWASRASVLI
jgi:hypothetical protein